MKKLLMTVAVLACAASIVSAQTTSANIVGYNKDVSAAAGVHISGMQFDNPTNNPTTVFGDQLPLGSKIYKWTGSGYQIAEYTSVFVPFVGPTIKWDSDPTLGNADGFWVEVPSAATATLSGEVPSDDSITNSIAIGVSMLSYPYPVDRVVTNLGFNPTVGDKIYVWTGSGYTISEYTSVFVPFVGPTIKWDNETLPVAVGQGFWYEAAGAQTWIVNKPF